MKQGASPTKETTKGFGLVFSPFAVLARGRLFKTRISRSGTHVLLTQIAGNRDIFPQVRDVGSELFQLGRDGGEGLAQVGLAGHLPTPKSRIHFTVRLVVE